MNIFAYLEQAAATAAITAAEALIGGANQATIKDTFEQSLKTQAASLASAEIQQLAVTVIPSLIASASAAPAAVQTVAPTTPAPAVSTVSGEAAPVV